VAGVVVFLGAGGETAEEHGGERGAESGRHGEMRQ
jgi:hypothetical protein